MRLLLAATSLLLLIGCPQQPAHDAGLLPWQIEVDDIGGSRVFGLDLGVSTLADAVAVLGDDYKLALFGAIDELPGLEAFFPTVALGGLTGRVVLNLELPPATLQTMRANARKQRIQVVGSERRWEVVTEDVGLALQASIGILSYVPSVNLEPDVIESRFGLPANREPSADGSSRWLYPRLGLVLIADPDGRELLQYMAPRDFDRLRSARTSTANP